MLNKKRVMPLPDQRRLAVACLSVGTIASLFLAVGCSNNQSTAPAKPADKNEPVTITIGVKGSGYLNDEEMRRYIFDPVKKKYPWITVEQVIYNGQGTKLPELLVAGKMPDIIMSNNINGFPELVELDLMKPMSDLIKKHNMDINRFDPTTLDAIKNNSLSNELVALPITRHFQALYYNKDISDKFGVPYPKDGMTWDDAIELAKKVTRKQDGVQYRGLEPNVVQRPASQLSLPYIDPKTNKAIFNTDEWKKALELLAKIYQIPGNEEMVGKNKANLKFAKDRTLAMLAGNNILTSAGLDKMPDFNWDLVSMPVWKEAPGKEPRIDETIMVPIKTSKNPDDAFRVIAAIVSDEVQLDMAKQGRISVLKADAFKQAFGKEITFMQGKNLQGVFKTTPAQSFVPSLYDTIGFDVMDTVLEKMVTKKADVNTALREAEESVNKQIQEKKPGK